MQDLAPNARLMTKRRVVLSLLLAVPALVLLFASCCSLSKESLELRLGELGKNTALGPLSRLSFEADLGDGQRGYELVYHHAPALRPSGKRPVVLIHGTPSTLYSWTEMIYGLGQSRRGHLSEGLRGERDVYALEVIGHGMAPDPGGRHSFERCARFIVAALEALELTSVHLVGSSYGGEFAWRAALNAPARIASLSLLDASGYQREDSDWLPEEVVMRDNPLAGIGWLLNSRARIEVALAPHFDQLPPDRVEEFFLVCDNASNWNAMIDLVRDENGQRGPELRELQPPTLLIWGEQDLAYSLEDYGQRFAREIPSAQLVVIPDTGHYPHEERPAEVLDALSSFFDAQEGLL